MKILTKIIDLSTLIIGIILGLRLILKLLGASAAAPFVTWLYQDLTQPLITPFLNIFPDAAIGKKGVLELSGFFALFIYIGLGYGISELVEAMGRNIQAKNIFRISKHEDKKA